MPSITATK